MPAMSTAKPDEADGEQLVVGGGDQAADKRRPPAGEGGEGEEEGEGDGELGDRVGGTVGITEHGLEESEVQGEEDVLHDDDAEDQRGSRGWRGGRSSIEQLGDDGRRRDADGTGDHQRLVGAPAEGEAEGEPAADVEERGRRPRCPASRRPRRGGR